MDSQSINQHHGASQNKSSGVGAWAGVAVITVLVWSHKTEKRTNSVSTEVRRRWSTVSVPTRCKAYSRTVESSLASNKSE